jgi:homoserine kinase
LFGGIFFASALCKNKLNKSQIADLAVKIEGHSDNVVPAVYSELCVCIKNEDEDHRTVVQLPLSKFKVVLCIPSFELRTNRSRQILPKNLSLKDVVFNTSSRGSLLIAAFYCQDYPLLKQDMEDKTHQPL